MAIERLTVLHVAPHPDDEMLGAAATLMALRDAGHRNDERLRQES